METYHYDSAMVKSAVCLAVGLVCLGSACRAGGSKTDPAVVSNTAALWSDGEEWLVSPAPVFEIGAASGAPEYELHNVVVGSG